MPPSGMTEPIPDSLWSGYGWFRVRLTAVEDFYHQPWFFYFFSWGAAEVYIDGELIRSYGRFSTDPGQEQRFNPSAQLLPAIALAPRDTHVVAVRYSYHPAQRYKRIMGDMSANFGFGIGFLNQSYNEGMSTGAKINARVLHLAVGVLLLVTLLHGFLFYRFPRQRSNLLIAIITFLLFLHALVAFSDVYWQPDRLMVYYLNYGFLLLIMLILTLLPFTITELFDIKDLQWTRWIPLLLVSTIPIIAFQLSAITFYFIGAVLILVLSCSVYALVKAKRQKKGGVGFVAFGFLGLPLVAFVLNIWDNMFSGTAWEFFSIGVIMIYLIIPVGITLFTSYQMSRLYSEMERMVDDRTAELKQSLHNLEAAQSQLIQQEKLASLGQLTAGIAHEIKNPLNFVNNFAELSIELIDELRAELQSPGEAGTMPGGSSAATTESPATSGLTGADENPHQKAYSAGLLSVINPLIDDVETNLRKIHEHGSRADRIVKSMLLHSRGGSGRMEPTDLNSMVKEYVNLAFHGMRASSEPFDVTLDVVLDPQIKEVKMMPEEFSRVILNLCNNAFDAMREKLKELGRSSYQPVLNVTTSAEGGQIMISVRDNGPGISDDLKDKILQPFFTTKKGTAGTGLGLSITHDVIKAHGGSIQIADADGGGAVFTVIIPVT
jgi:signal transduction histidine kinase